MAMSYNSLEIFIEYPSFGRHWVFKNSLEPYLVLFSYLLKILHWVYFLLFPCYEICVLLYEKNDFYLYMRCNITVYITGVGLSTLHLFNLSKQSYEDYNGAMSNFSSLFYLTSFFRTQLKHSFFQEIFIHISCPSLDFCGTQCNIITLYCDFLIIFFLY